MLYFFLQLVVLCPLQLLPRHALSPVLCNSQLFCNSQSRVHMIPCDHDGIHRRLPKLPDRLFRLVSGRIHHAGQSQEGKPLFLRSCGILLRCRGQHPKRLGGHPCGCLLRFPALCLSHGNRAVVFPDMCTLPEHAVRRAFGAGNACLSLSVEGRHHFPVRVKGKLSFSGHFSLPRLLFNVCQAGKLGKGQLGRISFFLL